MVKNETKYNMLKIKFSSTKIHFNPTSLHHAALYAKYKPLTGCTLSLNPTPTLHKGTPPNILSSCMLRQKV